MAPKLLEMDGIVERIHARVCRDFDRDGVRTLLVLASDHGMTTGGGHGGSSAEETDTVALFVGAPSFPSPFHKAGWTPQQLNWECGQ